MSCSRISNDVIIKNADSPFTEIFSILIKYNFSGNSLSLDYSANELMVVHQHIKNATQILLQGMQDVGQLLLVADREKMRDIQAERIGGFISGISNLLEVMQFILN